MKKITLTIKLTKVLANGTIEALTLNDYINIDPTRPLTDDLQGMPAHLHYGYRYISKNVANDFLDIVQKGSDMGAFITLVYDSL